MAEYNQKTLLFQQYHHTVLPRDVPGREDKNILRVEAELAERLTNAIKLFALHTPLNDQSSIDALRLTFSTCSALNIDGKIDKSILLKELQQLEGKNALIMHINEQNAALLAYYHPSELGDKSVVFEAFETSATCEDVMASTSALEWDFPGQAVSVPYSTYADEDFQCSLATFVEQASSESVKQFSAITWKACAPLPEIRDTSDPALITGMLMTILEAHGTLHDSPLLRKRVRDTVSFKEARKPWRRSSFYLVMRVAMQRRLYQLLGSEKGRLYYKTIMCIFLSKLMDDALHFIPGEASHALRQKLGRRLVKLDLDRDGCSKIVRAAHDHVFYALRPRLEKSLSSTTRFLELQWNEYKWKTTRITRPIQQYAHPSDLVLQLPLSGSTLDRIMHLRFSTTQAEIRSPDELLGRYENNGNLKPFVAVMNRYLPLCEQEEKLLTNFQITHDKSDGTVCIDLARKIETYISTVHNAYLDYPELMSHQLLILMELWVAMDRNFLNFCPLLADYHPGFDPSMFDILHLRTHGELKRLQAMQSYIASRCKGWCGQGSKTIFATPDETSFGVRYYSESDGSIEFQQLHQVIRNNADHLLKMKELEWKQKSREHLSKIQEMAGLSCVYVMELDENGYSRQVHKTPCRKHRLKWEAKQMKIQIFEYPLPRSDVVAKAVLFELLCPKAFVAYRDATWLILSTFAYKPGDPTDEVPLIRAYPGLSDYVGEEKSRVTLGSFTKSHLHSHYATCEFPVSLRDISRPFGLTLDYFDSSGRTWTSQKEQPSLAHLFPLKLPRHSPYESFRACENWPSSNRIIANQAKCPPEINTHEYTAWQGLLVGTYSRWPSLLREMGSTNINFSIDSTWAVISKLIFQVGPASSEDVLRDTHSVFDDKRFCRRILEQVDIRLEIVRRNWREPVQLDILISILLKVHSHNSDAKIRNMVLGLLGSVRAIIHSWQESLEFVGSEGNGLSIFVIWASVLLKRTYYPTMEAKQIHGTDLKFFLVASIHLQNSLVGKFDPLPYNLRNAILQDLRSSHRLRSRIYEALKAENQLFAALRTFWPVPTDCVITASFIDTQSWWATFTLATQSLDYHHIHYNYVYGTLLINGQQLGILPSEYRRWPIIQELFGSQALQIFPSTLRGMSLVVSRLMPFEHRVHLGFRESDLVIRAQHKGTVLELIPPPIFGNSQYFDLPPTLVTNCYHWLDLKSGTIEIRQSDPWKSKRSNWHLSLNTRQATRNNGSFLVDPNSNLAKQVLQNFYLFEYPSNITVYQPPNGNLRVELKRLELDFVVTRSGLLHCPQLAAVITESRSQDVGTWYGLRSKLVLRSVKNPSQYSILVPFGETIVERDGPHVSVVVKNCGGYYRFVVNRVLGRIECPAEPVLMYYRSLWHALTAHYLPDPLTGRTGVEEALGYLQSGAYQPWMPLPTSASSVLSMLRKLSPRRVYYPTGLKSMETVHWNPSSTTFIQDDRYRAAVDKILRRNTDLSRFSQIDVDNTVFEDSGEVHLETRALSRLYTHRTIEDKVYHSRDRRIMTRGRSKVVEIANLLYKWPAQIVNTDRLASFLQNFTVIGGYNRQFDKIQLTDILDADLGIEWGALARRASECSKKNVLYLTILFSLIAFRSDANMDLVWVLVSFAIFDDLKKLTFPMVPAYNNFRTNEVPDRTTLVNLMNGAKKPFLIDEDTRSGSPGQLVLRRLHHEKEAAKACTMLAESICAQWPCKELDLNRLEVADSSLLDHDEALALVLPEWNRLVDNFALSQHLVAVQLALQRHNPGVPTQAPQSTSPSPHRSRIYPVWSRGKEIPEIGELLAKDLSSLSRLYASRGPAQTQLCNSSLPRDTPNSSLTYPEKIFTTARQSFQQNHLRELSQIIAHYNNASSAVHKRYGMELQESIVAFSKHLTLPLEAQDTFDPSKLSIELFSAENSFQRMYEDLCTTLQNGDDRARWLQLAGLWPRLSTITLLRELRSTSGVKFGRGAKEALVDLGIAITEWQRLLRIKDAVLKSRHQLLMDEHKNRGHQNWSPFEHVDWLLLEIDGDIMLRAEQVDVALATVSPKSGQNSVVQLLMGKGKTSCILPMVALKLADKKLFRIVLPRSLILQSAQIMQSKLGGILDREVVHIPFSRRTPTHRTLMQTYTQLHTYIKKHNGVILALPEHILSFKLSGLQRLCDGKLDEAAVMMKAQSWLDRHARDVLDECDVSLAIRTQLIYPSGSQQTVDGHPLRWQTTQTLLHMVVSCLPSLALTYPYSVEIVTRVGYPLMYFLRKDAEEHMVTQIVQAICKGRTNILPIADFSVPDQKAIEAFISQPSVSTETTVKIIQLFKEKRHYVDVAYHLRGLFVHRIFLSTLKKRWNVQYGLHPGRDPVAVPYQAKGVPSPTAEWGHPDVAIILTCLSFYYEGLNLIQFKQAFEQLSKSDEPSIEYEKWVSKNVPDGLRDYNGINVEDDRQIQELHYFVRYNVCLLDFYLNTFVFPRNAKQFSLKLQASSWDLILFDPARASNCNTTGFSGTNDTRHQLPMMIKQNDLAQLAHTNAEVLAYLLEERNRCYVQMVDGFGKRLSEEGLLRKLLNPYEHQSNQFNRIRVLIDAGAQIMEHDNRSLAKTWLQVDREAVAAVYFDAYNRARVMYGKGTDMPLIASPFAENLEKCVVYIDESHCRGTDLKLPPYARAALTLGPHLTKDALTQAAMRLRLLGKTQSVAFFSPPEVHQSILDVRAAQHVTPSASLSSPDVIRWLLEKTCNDIEQLEPLYFTQGANYLQRMQAKLEKTDLEEKTTRESYLNVMRSKELQTLKQSYEPKYQQRGTVLKASDFAPPLQKYATELLKRRKNFQDRGYAVHSSALEEVEQEREVEFEVESVREVQSPVHFNALKFTRLHPDIENIAVTGRMRVGSDAYEPMFCALQKTALGAKHYINTTACTDTGLFVSTQFTRTVSVNEPNSNFLRPCHWILWSQLVQVAVLVSPEEANLLIPILRDASDVGSASSHLIVYAAPITRRMLHFNNLDYYAIPSLPENFKVPTRLRVELGIFAGRLYFEWNEYSEILAFLGIVPNSSDIDDAQATASKAFTQKPLAFLHEWLSIRRKDQDFEHTPMGFLTTGKPLFHDHPFFSTTEDISKSKIESVNNFFHAKEEREDSDDEDDHDKEHLFQEDGDGNDDEEEALYHNDDLEEKGNTFFKGGEYVEETKT